MAEKTHNGAQYDEFTDGGRPRATRKQRVGRHYKKFWWLYLILLIIVALAVVLPIIFVGYPNIARSGIKSSSIVLTAQIATNPTPSSVNLNLDSVLISHSAFKPQLDAWNGSFYMDGADKPFVTLEVPTVQAKNGTAINLAQVVQISDMEAFTNYTTYTLTTKSFNVYIRGSGGLKQGSLQKINVDYNEKVNITGLNNFEGLEVSNFRLATGLPYGANAYGNVTIPNPSVDLLTFGDVALNMTVAGVYIGNTTIPNLRLEAKNSTYPIYSTVNQTAVAGLLAQPAFKCGVIPINLTGVSVTYNGEDIPYYSAALRASKQFTSLNLTDTLNAAGLGSLITGACQSS